MEEETMISYEPAGMPRLEVRLSHDSIWMTMQQMAVVFDIDRSVIGKHIRNVYKTGEECNLGKNCPGSSRGRARCYTFHGVL